MMCIRKKTPSFIDDSERKLFSPKMFPAGHISRGRMRENSSSPASGSSVLGIKAHLATPAPLLPSGAAYGGGTLQSAVRVTGAQRQRARFVFAMKKMHCRIGMIDKGPGVLHL